MRSLYSTFPDAVGPPFFMPKKGMEKQTGLTVLSFGGGQDSTAILYKIILDPAFRSKWVYGDFIVVIM